MALYEKDNFRKGTSTKYKELDKLCIKEYTADRLERLVDKHGGLLGIDDLLARANNKEAWIGRLRGTHQHLKAKVGDWIKKQYDDVELAFKYNKYVDKEKERQRIEKYILQLPVITKPSGNVRHTKQTIYQQQRV